MGKKYAKRVLKSLGIVSLFKSVWDIKKSKFIPKPEITPLKSLLLENNFDSSICVYFEDIKKFKTSTSFRNYNNSYYK